MPFIELLQNVSYIVIVDALHVYTGLHSLTRTHIDFQPEGAAQVAERVVAVRVVGELALEEVSTSSQETGGWGSVKGRPPLPVVLPSVHLSQPSWTWLTQSILKLAFLSFFVALIATVALLALLSLALWVVV